MTLGYATTLVVNAMLTPIEIGNQGGELVSTNYWDSPMAKGGLLYLSWNAGVARILLPDNCKKILREIKTGKYCIISQGPQFTYNRSAGAVELLFEDHTDSPFSMLIAAGQVDRLVDCTKPQEGFNVTVWSRNGKLLSMPGKLRKATQLPCLQPW